MNSRRSQSTPLSSQSSLSRQNSVENLNKLKKSGDNLVIKAFKMVARIHNWIDWQNTFEKFKSDGYDDLNQAKLARVADLIDQYQLEGKIALQLYLELQKEHQKQYNPNYPFFPTQEEIKNISQDSLRILNKIPAEIKFQGSQKNNLPLNLIILFGPQNSGKTTFISACINFIRGLEYYSLLRYTVQKDEIIIKIDDGKEQYCFIKVEAFTNPYENRSMATKLISTLNDTTNGRELLSFSILYFAISTQTRIGNSEKYQVQKILETVPLNIKNFFIIKTFCTADKAEMVVFTGDTSPAHLIPGFIDNYIKKTNSGDGNKQKYIFNNKLFSYEYKNKNANQNEQNRHSSISIRQNNQQEYMIRQQSQCLDQSQISNNQLQQNNFINQENVMPQVVNQQEEQSSLNQSSIQELSMDKVDMTLIYWIRNKDNFIQLKKDIIEQSDPVQSRKELDQLLLCLEFLKDIELKIEALMEKKKNISQISKLIEKNIENLQIIKTKLKYIYIDHQENIISSTPLEFAKNVKILICKQCKSICHKACSNIEFCSRLKNNFCKSCFKNRNEICNIKKHQLKDSNQDVQDQTTSVIQVKAHLQESKDQKAIKDRYVRDIRLYQLDMFKLKRKYIEEVQKVQQFINKHNLPTNQQGFLQINFQNYKNQLDKIQLDNIGQLYHSVIIDLLEQIEDNQIEE